MVFKRCLDLTLFLFFFTFYSYPQITFQKTFNVRGDDFSYCVDQTIDAGYIITGYAYPAGEGDCDIYLLKTDSSGNALWMKTYGGSGDDIGYLVRETNDSGFVIVGSTRSFGNYYQVYLIKTNSIGDTLWTRTFGGYVDDEGYSVIQASDNGFVISGSTASFGGTYDVYLIKTDFNGNEQWTKTFGGINGDLGWSVLQTYDGGYIISGYTYSYGAGNNDIYLIKTNSDGDTSWTRCYGASGYDYGYGLTITSDSCYVIVGHTNSFSSMYSDIYLIKVKDNGDTLWTKTYGGEGVDYGYSVVQTSDGGYALVGFKDDSLNGAYDICLLKTNSSGELFWLQTFYGYGKDFGWSVQQTDDDGYIIAGNTQTYAPYSSDVYLIKTDNNGIVNGLPDKSSLPNNYVLYQNYPNPFNPTTTIRYEIPKRSFVEIKIYDVLGNEVATLINEEKPNGNYEIEFDGRELTSGIYFYQLRAGDFVETKKMILLK